MERGHILLVKGVQIQHGNDSPQIVIAVRNAVDQREAVVPRVDLKSGSKPSLPVLYQTVQMQDRLVKGLQKGILVIAEDFLSALVQQVKSGDPLIL